MIAYEVVVDGEAIHSTIDLAEAQRLADGWRRKGRIASYRQRAVPTELERLVSLCHRMNIERCRRRYDDEFEAFAEIMVICGKCKP